MWADIQQAWSWFWQLPHISLMLSVAWALYLLGLGVTIILQKREPAATLGWLLALAALPYLGFVIYFLFGPQKIQRQRLRRARSRLSLPTHEGDGSESVELARLGEATTGLHPSTAHHVQLLVDGAAKYAALIDDIRHATRHVHLEYYIFLPDHSGTALLQALVERAQAGVEVRLLMDAVGSGKMHRKALAQLVAAGGQVAWFHPMRLNGVWKFWRRPWLNLRTHRKIVVIDNAIGYVGGINVTDEENDSLRSDAYRDLHTRVEGEVVLELQRVFLEDWIYATGQRDAIAATARALPATHATPGPIRAQVVASGPDSEWEAIHRLQVSAIYAARTRVWLVTPYFVPSEAALMALETAALAGLDVRVMVPRESDSKLVTLAARSYYDGLLSAGVRVYEYGPRMLHTKALLVDESIAIIGSANFDNRSFRLNFEVAVLFEDAAVAHDLAQRIQAEFPNAPRLRERMRRSALKRLPEAFARLMAPLL